MDRLSGAVKNYDWGSPNAIPEFLNVPADGKPFGELWFGGHAGGPTQLLADDGSALTTSPTTLDQLVASDPVGVMGADIVARFGDQLPYLFKVIAPNQPLSLQVHPDIERARIRFDDEDAAGIAIDAPNRNYKDRNHKPEMVLALTRYEAVSGFRTPRRAIEVVDGLKSPLACTVAEFLHANPTRFGIKKAFSWLLSPQTRPTAEQVEQLVDEVSARAAAGASPSPRLDAYIMAMQAAFPGDPGVAAALLLNPVTLNPGEALFVPAGAVHAYISGLAVEIMSASDNVLRAGLTHKHVDAPEMLACVDYVAAPPMRPAPECLSEHCRAYNVPVEDFELVVTTVSEADGSVKVPGRGPRTLLNVDGELTVNADGKSLPLRRGQAVFVRADDGAISVSGHGTLVQADVP